MSLINTGLNIEIKGIKEALSDLGLLDQIQDSVALSADNLIVNIKGVNTVFASLSGSIGKFNTNLKPAGLDTFSTSARVADGNLTGFSTAVQNTVPHLQKIAAASNDINSVGFNTLKDLKINNASIDAAAISFGKLETSFKELNTVLEGGIKKSLQDIVSVMSQSTSNNFGSEVNQLALGFQKLNQIKDVSAIAENLNKFLSVLRRLADIPVAGALADLSSIGPAISSVGTAFRTFNKGFDASATKSISTVTSTLKLFSGLDLSKTSAELPAFSVGLLQVAEAFKKFSSGAPGDKLPTTLKAVSTALKEFLTISNNVSGNGFSKLTTDLTGVAAPLKQFADGIGAFTTGKAIADLPQRAADVKTALMAIRDAFALKNIDTLGPKLAGIAPALEQLASAFRSFTTGTNIKDLSVNITTIINALRNFTTLNLGTTGNDLAVLAPNVKALADAFRAFTGGTNIDQLPARISAVVNALTQLRDIKLGNIGANLTGVSKPLADFFTAFRAFSGSEKFGNLGKRFSELQTALNNLRKLNLASFSKELEGVSVGLTALVRATSLVNSQNIDKLAVTFATLRGQSSQLISSNKYLAASYNILVAPIANTANLLKNLGITLVKFPVNVFIAQLKLLKAVFLDLPINIIKTGFNAFSKAVSLVANTLRGVVQLIKNIAAPFKAIHKAFNDLGIITKALLFPLTALVQVFNSIINIGAKVASIFTAFKVDKVSKDVAALNAGLQTSNNSLTKTGQVAQKASNEFTQMGGALLKSEQETRRLSTGFNLVNIAIGAINTARIILLGNNIATATSRLLTFAVAAKSLQILGAAFTRLSQIVRQFSTQIVGGAFQAIATFEQLSLQITSLLAKEFVSTGQAGSVQEALGMDELNTTFNETLAIIKKLAIESPFDNVDIINVYKMAASFGFARKEALDMTAILVDASSALGLTGSETADIAKVFGQIKSVGKVLAGDLNQLAQRGINVKTILKDYGLTLEDVQKGALSADQVIQLVLNTLNKDFGGAAARATNTLAGLASTFGSLREEVLRVTFTPLFEALKPFANQLLSTFANEDFLKKVENFGNILRDNVLDVILAIAKPIVFLTTAFFNLPEPVQRAVVLFAKFAATAVVVSAIVASVQAAVVVLGGWFAVAFNPISIVIAGFISLISIMVKGRETIYNFAATIGGFVYSQILKLAQVFPIVGTALTQLETLLAPVGKAISGVFAGFSGSTVKSDALSGLTAPVQAISDSFSATGQKIKETSDTAKTSLVSLGNGFTAASDSVNKLNTPLKAISGELIKFTANTAKPKEGLKAISGELVKMSTISAKPQAALKAISGDLIKMNTDVAKPKDGLKGLDAALANTSKSLTGTRKIIDAVGGTVRNVSTPVKEISFVINQASDSVGKLGTATTTAEGPLAKLGAFFTTAINSIASGITFLDAKITQFGTGIGAIFNQIGATIQPGIAAVQNSFNIIELLFVNAGINISSVFNGIGTLIISQFGGLGTGISGELGSLGDFFVDFLTDVTDFGGGLIESFSGGILGALNLVADALLEIAKLVTFWLQPGSPPRILPDIDKWGSGLIVAWIDGMVAVIGPAFTALQPIVEQSAKQIFTVFQGIGNFTFETIVNSIKLLGGVFTEVFNSLVGIGKAFLTQFVLVFNLIGNSFSVILNPALSFKDKFIQVFNEIGNFIGGTFLNIIGLSTTFGKTISGIFQQIGLFVVNEFVSAFNSLKFIFPQLDGLSSKILDFASKSTKSLSEFGTFATNFFTNLLDTVTGYGSSLITAFSNGIIGAVNVVAGALQQLGNLIAFWLAPGSPPRLLPEIDKWGTSAANEFLGGFTTADFDKIEDFGSTAEKLLENINIAPGTDIDFQGIYEGFAEALSKGSLDDSTFADLRAQAPAAAAELEALAQTYFTVESASTQLEQANNKVAESQKKVAEETEKIKDETAAYDAAISELEGKLTDIDTASTYDAEIKKVQQLQEVINDRYSSEYEKVQAGREIEKIKNTQTLRSLKAQKAASETALKASEEQLKADEDAVKSKEGNLSASQQELEALKARLALAEKFGSADNGGTSGSDSAADAADAAIKGIKAGDLIDADGIADKISGAIDAGIGDAGDGLDTSPAATGIAEITKNVKTAFDEFKKKLQQVKDGVTNFFNNIKEQFGKIGTLFKPVTDALGKLFTNTTLVKGAFIGLGLVLAGPLILGVLGTIAAGFAGILAVIGPLATVILGVTAVVGGLGFAVYLLSQNVLSATGLFGEGSLVLDGVLKKFSELGDSLKSFGNGFVTGIFDSEQTFISSILGFDTANISTSLGKVAAEIGQAFLGFNVAIFKSFTGIAVGKNPIDTFLSEITGKDYSGSFQTFATNLGNSIYTYVQNAILLFQTNIASSGLAIGIKNSIVTLIGQAFTGLTGAVSGLANFDLSTIEFNIGGMTLTGGPELGGKLATLLGDSFSFLNTIDFSTPATVIQTAFETAFNTIQPIVSQKFVEFMTAVFGSNAGPIIDTLSTTLTSIGTTFDTLFTNIQAKGVVGGILQTIFGANSQSILDNFSLALDGLGAVFGTVGGAFDTFLANIEASGLGASLQNLGTQISYASQEVLKLVGPLVAGVVGVVFVTLLEVLKELPSILTNVIDLFANLFERIGNIAKAISDVILGNTDFSEFLGTLFGEIFGIFTDIGTFMSEFGDNISNVITGAITTIGDLIGIDTGPFIENWGWIIDIVGDLIATALLGWITKVGNLFTWVVEKVKPFIPILGNLGKAFIGLFTGKNAPATFLQTLGRIARLIFDNIKKAILGFIVFATSKFDNFNLSIAGMRLAFEGFKNKVLEIYENIKNTFAGFGLALQQAFAPAKERLTEFVTQAATTFTTIKDGIVGKFNEVKTFFSGLTIPNPFTALSTAIFGSDGFVFKITNFPAVFDGYLASVTITNPFIFLDEFIALFKITIEDFPLVFQGLLDSVLITNPFETLNELLFGEAGFSANIYGIGTTFSELVLELTGIKIPNPFDALYEALFGEAGFVSQVLGIGSSFVTSASRMTGIDIPDPFKAVKATLSVIKTVIGNLPQLFTDLGEAIKKITVSDRFKAISESLGKLLEGAKGLLKIDLSGFSKVFEPVTATISSLKTQFDELTAKFTAAANLIPGINIGGAEVTGSEEIQAKIKAQFGDTPVSTEQKLDLIFEDPKLKDKAVAILTEFEVAYDGASGTFTTDFAAINKTLLQKGFTAEDIIAVANAAGVDVADGFAAGFSADTANTTRDARQLATNTLLDIKEALGIQSPSTEARDQIGIPFVQGVLLPFGETDLITPATQTFIDNLISLLSSNVESASSTIASNITNALFPAFTTAGTELATGLSTSATTTLTNADIPVNLTTDYNAQGQVYGQDLGKGFVTGLDTALSKTTGLSGISVLFTNTTNLIKQTVTAFKTVITTDFTTLYNTITQNTTAFLNNLLKLWTDKLAELMELFEEFVAVFLEVLTTFTETILEMTLELFTNIIDEFSTFSSTIITSYTTFTSSLVGLTKKAIDDIIAQFRRLGIEIVPIVEAAIASIKAALAKIVTVFKDIGEQAVEAFTEAIGNLYAATETALDEFVAEILAKYSETTGVLYKAGFKIGQDFIAGWAAGMKSKLPPLLVVVGDIADSIIAKTKASLAIESPSKVMFKLGEYTTDGLALGMRNKIGAVNSSMSALVGAVTNNKYKNQIANFVKDDLFGTINTAGNKFMPGLELSANNAQKLMMNVNTGQSVSTGNKEYNRIVANNMLGNTTSYVNNNSYNMVVNTKPEKTVSVRRQFKTMQFIGVK